MSAYVSTTDRPASAASGIEWGPYLAGVGIGVLSWIAFAVAKDPIGVTTAFGRIAGEVAIPILGAETVASNTYWKQSPFAFDYGVIFLIGLMLGAFVSAIASGTFRIETVPAVWKERFGGSALKRFAAAFVGGAIIMYGARLAGGCTSGHGISGGLQLAVSSWVFLAVMFLSGILASAVIYRGKAA